MRSAFILAQMAVVQLDHSRVAVTEILRQHHQRHSRHHRRFLFELLVGRNVRVQTKPRFNTTCTFDL